MKRWSVRLLLVLGAVIGMGGQAAAQDGVISLDETVIKGRIQKPEAFYILKNADLSYEGLDVKPSFLDEVVETVETEPF